MLGNKFLRKTQCYVSSYATAVKWNEIHTPSVKSRDQILSCNLQDSKSVLTRKHQRSRFLQLSMAKNSPRLINILQTCFGTNGSNVIQQISWMRTSSIQKRMNMSFTFKENKAQKKIYFYYNIQQQISSHCCFLAEIPGFKIHSVKERK